MRNVSVRLYSVAIPLFALPVMGFAWDQVVPYLKGTEFRTLLAQILTQVVSGVVDTAIAAGVQSLFS